MKKENTAMFIGHSQCYNLNRTMLKEKIIFLIENGIDTFLSGGMGEFDRAAAHEVHRLKKQYPHIKNKLVIAYLNAKIDDKEIYDEIVFPEGQEFCHYKAAIPKRNRYMVESSTYAICHVTHSWGGAATTYRLAEKKGVVIIDI